MGQRKQVFIIIPSPYKKAEKALETNKENSIKYPNRYKKSDLADIKKQEQELKQLAKEFGTGDKTVLAFHHQWLYGATALAIAHNFLEFTKPKKDDQYYNPLNKDSNMLEPTEIVSYVKNLLSIHRGIKGFAGRESGYESFHYLNKDEPEMREDFTRGDNNDGVTIIDTTTGKYCFMNIGHGDSSIMKAKPLTPLSAIEYLECYYNTDVNQFNEYDKEEFFNSNTEGKKKIMDKLESNKKLIKKAEKLFKKFQLLSLSEIKEVFHKVNFNQEIEQAA